MNSEIDYNIAIKTPPGIEELNTKLTETDILTLLKALYGMKQAPHLWSIKTLLPFLKQIGFTQSAHEACMFTWQTSSQLTLLIYWVDDILIASTDEHTVMVIVKKFEERFKVHDLGSVSRYLGMTIKDDKTKV